MTNSLAPVAAGNATIAAIASGFGRGAIAVLRMSGPDTLTIVDRLIKGDRPTARRASLRTLLHPGTGEAIDQALVLTFLAPASFTGEDAAEFHVHGGIAVRAAMLDALVYAGCRLAEPGEFTRRAFASGRLDLTAVEGLADLIDAETESQRRQALQQASGRLAATVASWRERLVEALAFCEAALDFADEGDVPPDVSSLTCRIVAAVQAEVTAALASVHHGERVREGFVVVIAGPPNAGKSSLLNAIADRDVAIVSPMPGTTRDVIEIRCDLSGWPVTFVDTAGLREGGDAIEQDGMVRTRGRLASADLILWLSAADGMADDGPSREFADIALRRAPIERVWTKIDLVDPPPGSIRGVSTVTGIGLADLLAFVTQAVAAGPDRQSADVVLTRARHREVIADVQVCLQRAISADTAASTELTAEDLRLALRALGRLTGAVDVEEVLDRVFSSFCIGK